MATTVKMDRHEDHGMHSDSGMTTMYPENRIYAQEFWYIIAAAIAIFAFIRIGREITSRLRYGTVFAHIVKGICRV